MIPRCKLEDAVRDRLPSGSCATNAIRIIGRPAPSECRSVRRSRSCSCACFGWPWRWALRSRARCVWMQPVISGLNVARSFSLTMLSSRSNWPPALLPIEPKCEHGLPNGRLLRIEPTRNMCVFFHQNCSLPHAKSIIQLIILTEPRRANRSGQLRECTVVDFTGCAARGPAKLDARRLEFPVLNRL